MMYDTDGAQAYTGVGSKLASANSINDAPIMQMYKRLSESYNRLLDQVSTLNSVADRLMGEVPTPDGRNQTVAASPAYGGQYAELEGAVRNIESACERLDNATIRVSRLG